MTDREIAGVVAAAVVVHVADVDLVGQVVDVQPQAQMRVRRRTAPVRRRSRSRATVMVLAAFTNTSSGVADASPEGQFVRQLVGGPDAAREVRRQQQRPAVVGRVLRQLFGVQVAEVGQDLPAVGDPSQRAERDALHQLAVVLVVERRDRRRVHREDDVLVLGAEDRAGQRQPVAGDVPLACRPRGWSIPAASRSGCSGCWPERST